MSSRHLSRKAMLARQAALPSTLAARAERIRAHLRDLRRSIIEIGRELIAAKGELRHGQWLPWLDQEFGWTERTAQRYIAIATAFKNNSVSHLTIDASALTALAGPKVPQAARREAITRARAGERVTKKVASDIIVRTLPAKASPLRRQATLAPMTAVPVEPLKPPEIDILVAHFGGGDDKLHVRVLDRIRNAIQPHYIEGESFDAREDRESDAVISALMAASTDIGCLPMVFTKLAKLLAMTPDYPPLVPQEMFEYWLDAVDEVGAARSTRMARKHRCRSRGGRSHAATAA